jgi:hypothetical protein
VLILVAFGTTWLSLVLLAPTSKKAHCFLDEFSIAQEESLSVAWYTVLGGMKNDELMSF